MVNATFNDREVTRSSRTLCSVPAAEVFQLSLCRTENAEQVSRTNFR